MNDIVAITLAHFGMKHQKFLDTCDSCLGSSEETGGGESVFSLLPVIRSALMLVFRTLIVYREFCRI